MVGKFQILHSYKALADKGVTKHLMCPNCGTFYTIAVEPDGEPVLVCYTCSARVRLGSRTFDQIKAVVKEHVIFVEEID